MWGWPALLLVVALAVPGPAHASHHGPVDCSEPQEVPADFAAATRTPGSRIGLALGSGSVHGIAHVGVIRELEARGVDVRVVTGTSVGALVGSLWASGMKARELEDLVLAFAAEDHSRFTFFGEGLYSNLALREALGPAFRGRPIEAWPRRFGAVATNVASGQRRIIMTGEGALAVQASAAAPVIFAPVRVANERLVDGALVEPVPVDAARALGADFVIAVDVAYRPYEEPVSGVSGIGFQAMHILVNSLATEQLKRADVAIRLDLHERMSCGPAALVEAGARALRAAWPEIERGLRRAPAPAP
jgi:NTE family protein